MKADLKELRIEIDSVDEAKLTNKEKREVDKIFDEWVKELQAEAKDSAARDLTPAYLEQKRELELAMLEKVGIRDEALTLLDLEPGQGSSSAPKKRPARKRKS